MEEANRKSDLSSALQSLQHSICRDHNVFCLSREFIADLISQSVLQNMNAQGKLLVCYLKLFKYLKI